MTAVAEMIAEEQAAQRAEAFGNMAKARAMMSGVCAPAGASLDAAIADRQAALAQECGALKAQVEKLTAQLAAWRPAKPADTTDTIIVRSHGVDWEIAYGLEGDEHPATGADEWSVEMTYFLMGGEWVAYCSADAPDQEGCPPTQEKVEEAVAAYFEEANAL